MQTLSTRMRAKDKKTLSCATLEKPLKILTRSLNLCWITVRPVIQIAFIEDQVNGWSKDSIRDLFEGAELVPDSTPMSGFQNDRFQTEALLRLTGMVRLLQIRVEDFKINALMFAALSLSMTLIVLCFYTGILAYVATQKCQVKLNARKIKKLKAQERHFRRIISQERRTEGEAQIFDLN